MRGDTFDFDFDFVRGSPRATLESVRSHVAQNGSLFRYYAQGEIHEDFEVVDNFEIVQMAVTQDGCMLRYASERLRGIFEIALAAVTENGNALQYASDALKGNNEIVLAAVTEAGWALKYASNEFESDYAVVLAAVTRKGRVLEHASKYLQSDPAIVLAAVTQDGNALEYASKGFQSDPAIVLAAVTQDGSALEYASENLQGDFEIVLAAVTENGWALEYASLELKNNIEIVLAAVAQNDFALQHASAEMRDTGFESYIKHLSSDVYAVPASVFIYILKALTETPKSRIENSATKGAAEEDVKPQLKLLSKLGKYHAQHVSKLIADYAGVRYAGAKASPGPCWKLVAGVAKSLDLDVRSNLRLFDAPPVEKKAGPASEKENLSGKAMDFSN